MDYTGVTFPDKILPTQPFNREYFQGDDQSLLVAMYDTMVRYAGLNLPTEEFILQTDDTIRPEVMASGPMILKFLQALILMTRARHVLEVGTFIGVSAMSMAKVLPEGGRVVTIEKFERFANIARVNFARNGLGHKIELIHGDAFEELRKLSTVPQFELILLDGNKEKHAYPVNSSAARKSTLRWGLWLMAPQPVRACGVNRIGMRRNIPSILIFWILCWNEVDFLLSMMFSLPGMSSIRRPKAKKEQGSINSWSECEMWTAITKLSCLLVMA